MMLLGFTATNISAQKACAKSTKKCAKTCAKKGSASNAKVLSMADELAKNDDSIEKRICAKSGKVSYFQKSTCAKSGKVKINEVKFCEKSKSFVNVAPSVDTRSIAERLSAERTTLVKVNGEEVGVPKTRTQLEQSASSEAKKTCTKNATAGKACSKKTKACSKAKAVGSKKGCCKKSAAGTKSCSKLKATTTTKS